MTQATESVVRRSITVAATVDRAFTVFTDGYTTWWPKDHHIGATEPEAVVFEARPGGRWYERGADDQECDWGRILAWEPPHRLVIAWMIGADWQYDPDPAHASEVEIRFVAETPDRTRVEIEHRGFDRHGPRAESVRAGVASDQGWGLYLDRLAAALEGRDLT